MNFVCGMFLMFMSEEEAFWLMVKFVDVWNMGEMWSESFAYATQCCGVLKKLIAEFLPNIWKKIADWEEMYPPKISWFLTIFMFDGMPFRSCLRVMDCILCEGDLKVVYRVALAALKLKEADILNCRDDCDWVMLRDGLMKDLHDADKLLETAFNFKLKRTQLDKYIKAYQL